MTFPVLSVKPAHAQDSNGPSPLSALDTTAAPFDILVDSSLSQDNPAQNQYRTLQAAYMAAPAGTATRQTVIGIKPDVYQITGGVSTPGLTINKNFITLLGLTNDHRNVVLADNRGNQEGAGTPGATNNGYVIIVSATGFQAINLTILNYCNVNYEYPGNPAKNLTERSATITQAVALQASGDKHVYDHVALLSRLDTTFIQTSRAYFTNVYIEGTDDFIGGGTVSVWSNSVVNFPTGSGVPSVSGTIFINSTFTSSNAMAFYKGFPSNSLPATLINCTMPVNTTGQSVAWVRGFAPTMQTLFSLTYHIKDANGNPTTIADGSQGPITHDLTRELSDAEMTAFNPWNVLRATPTGTADNWDPAGVEAFYDNLSEGNLPIGMTMTNGHPSIITGQTTATIGAAIQPARASGTITWSTASNLVSLNQTVGASIIVTGTNNTGVSTFVPITASASNGFHITAWVLVQPPFISPPAFISGPTVGAPFNGTVTTSYALNLPPNPTEQSIITWYSCSDSSGSNPRTVAVSNGNIPLKTYTLQLGDVGRFMRVGIQPKVDISNAGPAVFAVASTPILLSDIKSTTVSPNFTNFVTANNTAIVNGYWTVTGGWANQAQPVGSTFVNGWGARVQTQNSTMFYQQDSPYGDMIVNVVMSPEKTAGQGFGSPATSGADNGGQRADLFIKYDQRTQTGYSLRWWRTTASATDCMFQLYQINAGVGSPVAGTSPVQSGVFKPNTNVTLSIIGTTFTASAINTGDGDSLTLTGTVAANTFGGAGTFWGGTTPAGNSNVYSQFQLSYPGTVQLSASAVLTKLGGGAGYQAVVTVKNTGTAYAQNVALTGASIGSANGSTVPAAIGNLAPGASQTVTITYPSTAGASGAATVEKYTGIYTGGSFTVSIRATLP